MRIALAALLASGCYHPTIPDQSFVCGPDGLCPSGFSCNAARLCEKSGANTVDGGSSGLYSGVLGTTDLSGLSGILECSTKTGQMKLRVGSGPNEVDTIVVPASAAGFFRLAQTSGPALGVWSFQSLTVPAGVTMKPASDSDAMPIFAAVGPMVVDGPVDWRGFGGFGGLAGQVGQDRGSGVASGGAGGGFGGGGGGAGYASVGDAGTGGARGGASYGTADLAILHAGAGGGGGGDDGGRGGNGGGSVALVSQARITLGGTIDVSGTAGGTGGAMGGGGGGGGSGGSILVSAPQVTLSTGHMLTSLGGTAGAGSNMEAGGGAGSTGRIWIAGTTSGPAAAEPKAGAASLPSTTFPAGATAAP